MLTFAQYLQEAETTSPVFWATALCGAKPGRLSGSGFVAPMDRAATITCPRCLAKLPPNAEIRYPEDLR